MAEMMAKQQKHTSGTSARVMKVMGLFSGVQVMQVLCSAVKYKLVSIWLHATGVGLFGIYNTTVETIAALTDTGLRNTSVRDVARASGNRRKMDHVVAIVRSWSAVIGIVAALLMVAAAPILSSVIFGTLKYWWQFAILSFATLANSLLSGEKAVLQGIARFKIIAKVTMLSSIAGLVVSIPMFYYLGDEGVVWSFVAYPIVGLLITLTSRYRAETVERPSRQLLADGKEMVTLGGYMAIALFVGNLAQTLFIAWLNREGSTAEVGFYNAGSTLVVRYVGFVMGAIGMEFYPRISAHVWSRKRVQTFVNHEISLLMTAIVPLLLCFLIFREVIVRILYTEEFLVIIPFITAAAIQPVFRAAAACFAYTIVARGNGKIYIAVETIDSIVGLSLCMLGYTLYGLTGIGFALVAWYLLYLLLVSSVYIRIFQYRISRDALVSIVIAVTIVALSAAAATWLSLWIAIPCMAIPLIIYVLRLKNMLIGKRR